MIIKTRGELSRFFLKKITTDLEITGCGEKNIG